MTNKKESSVEFRSFAELTRALLSVPHSEVQRRIEEHKRQTANNPQKRGPKPKEK